MAAAEESPILIPSEDEDDEDGDDVQYIKEEKAPPITIDENEDADDIIFVSTCPGPAASPPMAASWDEQLSITDSLDLATFTLGTPAGSPPPPCTTSAMQQLPGSSSLDAALTSIGGMVGGDLSQSVALGSTIAPNIAPNIADIASSLSSVASDDGDKLVGDTLTSDFSLGAGSDLSVTGDSSTLSPMSSLASVPNLSDIQLSDGLPAVAVTTATDISSSLLPLSSISGTSMSLMTPSSCSPGDPTAMTDSSKAVLASNSGMAPAFSFQPGPAFLPAVNQLSMGSSLDNKLQDRKAHRVKKRRDNAISGSDSDPNFSDSSDTGGDAASDASDEDEEESDDQCGGDVNKGVSGKALSMSPPLHSSTPVVSFSSNGAVSGSGVDPSLAHYLHTDDVSQSMSCYSPLTATSLTSTAGLSLSSAVASSCSQQRVPSLPIAAGSIASLAATTTAASSCVSDHVTVIDLVDLGTSFNSQPTTTTMSTSVMLPLLTSSACLPLAGLVSASSRPTASNPSHSSVIHSAQSVGAMSTPSATQMSFSSPSVTPTCSLVQLQPQRISSCSAAANSCTKGVVASYQPQCVNGVTSMGQKQPLTPLQCQADAQQKQSLRQVDHKLDLQVSAHSAQGSQRQILTAASSGTAARVDSCSSNKSLLPQDQQASARKPCTTTEPVDYFDKLLGECHSIIFNNSVPSTGSVTCSVSSPIVSAAVNTSASTISSSEVSSTTSGQQDSTDDMKTSKRPSPSSFSSLNYASLPPRKRVRPLHHSASCSGSASSSGASSSLDLDAHILTAVLDCSLPADHSKPTPLPADHSKPTPLPRSSSYPAATGPSRGLSDGASSTGKSAGKGSASWGRRESGSGSGSSKGQGLPSLGIGVAGTSQSEGADVVTCQTCRMKEGETGRDGEKCRLSFCPVGHPSCGSCLMVQAKSVLSGKQKESLKCLVVACGSFYPVNELKNSLPSLIVEILQERFDIDIVKCIDDLLTQGDAGSDSDEDMDTKSKARKNKAKAGRVPFHLRSPSISDSDDDADIDEAMGISRADSDLDLSSFFKVRKGGRDLEDSRYKQSDSSSKDQRNEFPEHWTRMDSSKNLVEVVAVPLKPNSDEYINVAVRFHEHMRFPSADITKIIRIQNPYLWKSYSLKKEQMLQENGGMVISEYQLFHGTKVNTIDAICRRGFDWRFCGKHGTAYGQGCYFAGDSLYSNTYTDRSGGGASSSATGSGVHFLKSIMQLSSSSPSYGSGSILLAPPPPAIPKSPLNTSLLAHRTASVILGPGPATSLDMHKFLLTLKNRGQESSNVLLAHLLKTTKSKDMVKLRAMANSMRRQARFSTLSSSTLPGGASASLAPSSSSVHPGAPVGGGQSPQGSLGQAPGHGGHPSRSLQSVPSQHMYQYQGYHLLPGTKRPQPTPSQAHQPQTSGKSHHHGGQGHPGLPGGQGHPPSHGGGGGGGGSRQKPVVNFAVRKPIFPPHHPLNKYLRRPSYPAGSLPASKPSSVLLQPSSVPGAMPAQQVVSGAGGLLVPTATGGYSASASLATTAVTLSGAGGMGAAQGVGGGGGTQPLAILTTSANPGPSMPGAGSYVLVAPLGPSNPPPPQAPAPIPPSALASIPPPPPPQLLAQGPGPALPTALTAKNPVWPGSLVSSSQALDLRKTGGTSPRYMFLARVLTGRSTGGDSEYRRPPPLDPQDPLGKCYDSCVDNIYTPRIWVIFDSTQAYPEYIIEYNVNGDLYR